MLNIRYFISSVLRVVSHLVNYNNNSSIFDQERLLGSISDDRIRARHILRLVRLYRKAQLFPDILTKCVELLDLNSSLTKDDRAVIVDNFALALHREGRTTEAIELLESSVGSCLPSDERSRLTARYAANLMPERALKIYRDLPNARLTPSDLRIYCQMLIRARDLDGVGRTIDHFVKRRSRLRPVSTSLEAELSLLRYEVALRQQDSSKVLAETARLFENLKIDAAPVDLTPKRLTSFSASRRDQPTSSRHKVSIVMTTFNSARWLEMSIFSLLSQTYSNIEVIIVDDCSTDGATLDVLHTWMEKDKRVRVLRTFLNSGTYVAKNQGLEVATGDLVTFHDSDDWAHPHRIALQVSAFESDNLIANQSQWFKVSDEGYPILKHWGSYIYSNPASIMVRRKVFDELGKFDTVRIGADTEFIARVRCCYGESSYVMVPQALTVGTERQNALTSSGIGQMDANGFNAVRSAYAYAWRRWHLEIAAGVCTEARIDRRVSHPFRLPVELQG